MRKWEKKRLTETIRATKDEATKGNYGIKPLRTNEGYHFCET